MTSEREVRLTGTGHLTWYFPDGDRPPTATGSGDGPAWLEAHESMMILNVGPEKANVELDLFWEDREPELGLKFTVGGQRVRGLRVPWRDDTGREPEIPFRTQYAIRVRSDRPIICQYGRAEVVPSYTLYTTMGLAAGGDQL